MPGMDATRLLRRAESYLQEYLDKIRACVELLSDEQVWWRPHAGSNSAGNLILHLCGNLSQWVVAGLGGAAPARQRSLEFAARGGVDKQELLDRLSRVVASCRETLAGLAEDDLSASRRIQGIDTDGLGALMHAVEHMSYHTGQIAFITKQLLGEGHTIEFYPQHREE